MDSLPAQPQGKPRNTGVGSLSLPQWIFLTQESNWGLLNCRWILYQLSYLPIPCIPQLTPSHFIHSFVAWTLLSHLCSLVIALGAFWVSEIHLTLGPWKKFRTHSSWRRGHGKHSGISEWKQEQTCSMLLQAGGRVTWIRYLFNIRLSHFN